MALAICVNTSSFLWRDESSLGLFIVHDSSQFSTNFIHCKQQPPNFKISTKFDSKPNASSLFNNARIFFLFHCCCCCSCLTLISICNSLCFPYLLNALPSFLIYFSFLCIAVADVFSALVSVSFDCAIAFPTKLSQVLELRSGILCVLFFLFLLLSFSVWIRVNIRSFASFDLYSNEWFFVRFSLCSLGRSFHRTHTAFLNFVLFSIGQKLEISFVIKMDKLLARSLSFSAIMMLNFFSNVSLHKRAEQKIQNDNDGKWWRTQFFLSQCNRHSRFGERNEFGRGKILYCGQKKSIEVWYRTSARSLFFSNTFSSLIDFKNLKRSSGMANDIVVIRNEC